MQFENGNVQSMWTLFDLNSETQITAKRCSADRTNWLLQRISFVMLCIMGIVGFRSLLRAWSLAVVSITLCFFPPVISVEAFAGFPFGHVSVCRCTYDVMICTSEHKAKRVYCGFTFTTELNRTQQR